MIIIIVNALTWTFVGPEGGDVVSISSGGSMALAASPINAYYSTDGAASWSRVSATDGLSPVPGFIPSFRTAILAGRMYVFHSDGYLYSDDGNTWSSGDYSSVTYVSEPLNGSFTFVAGNTLYRLRSGSSTPDTLLSLSTDSTIVASASFDTLWYAFVRVNDSLDIYRGINTSYSIVGKIASVDINDVAINPDNPNELMLATTGSGIVHSSDGGASFSVEYGSILAGLVVVLDVDFLSTNSIRVASFYMPGIYDGSRGYFWSYNSVYDEEAMSVSGDLAAVFGRGVLDIATSNFNNSGLYAHVIYTPGMVSNSISSRLTFINMGGALISTNDGGSTWNSPSFKMDIGTAVEVAPYDENIIFVGGHRAYGTLSDPRSIVLARSTDGGATFDPVIDTPITAIGYYPFEIQVGSSSSDVFMVYGRPGYWDMMYSPDTGSTFSTVMHNGGYNGFCFSCIDTLFLITDTGDVYWSVDAGATWNYILSIGYPGNVYATYWNGNLYYSTGHDAYLRVIDPAGATIDSVDLSSYLDSVMEVQVSRTGILFLTGYAGGAYKVAYGASLTDLTVEDAPAVFGGVIPLNDYVFFYSTTEGGFYAAQAPVYEKEVVDRVNVRYTRWGILLEGITGPVDVYDLNGRLVKRINGNRIYSRDFSSGLYILKTSGGTFKVIIR